MLEKIIQGLFMWQYNIALEVWEYFSSQLIQLMSMDFAYLQSHMPILPAIRSAILAAGWALLIGNLVFQALKTMVSGLGFEGEDPKLLFTRTFVFAFLLLVSPQICDTCLAVTSRMIELMELPKAVQITFPQESSFVGLSCAWLLVMICGVIIMFQSFKLIIEMAERYFILAVLTVTAPLAFGTGGSRQTADIFTGWCRMFGSMCALMVTNVMFIKMLLSVLSYTPSGLDMLPWMVLVLTVVKVAKKADAIITRIGLNPAITGDSLGRMFPGTLTYMVARTAISGIAKSVAGGRSENTQQANTVQSGGKTSQSGAAFRQRGKAEGFRHTAHGGADAAQRKSSVRQESARHSPGYTTASQQTVYGTAIGISRSAEQTQIGHVISGARQTSVPPDARRVPIRSRAPDRPVQGSHQTAQGIRHDTAGITDASSAGAGIKEARPGRNGSNRPASSRSRAGQLDKAARQERTRFTGKPLHQSGKPFSLHSGMAGIVPEDRNGPVDRRTSRPRPEQAASDASGSVLNHDTDSGREE